MPENAPRDPLDKAREALRTQNYSEALTQYEYFFDHALDDDPALYGVRLSFCLSEWASLGLQYPAAMERLVQKKADALLLLEQTRNPERFHDYLAICRHLKCSDQAISQFLAYHASASDIAPLIVRFIWNDLVDAQQWEVCAAYLTDAMDSYRNALMQFDRAMNAHKQNPDLGREDFEKRIKGSYVRDVSNILRVLRNNGNEDDIRLLQHRFSSDMQTRGHAELIPEIRARLVQ